ncbi:heavy-metal-associated domain-containing protein [Kosmotoga pacifica]|uniref:Heavy metal transport/detoxification protein n=1 Tax=Kosmotoga pacifica TaxID=1330330 RepID=A0A0G2ZCP8_9BACT|nr:heavy-metal-associated domain-containing protein [Kosmotoga pacifica]AKI97324.1 heavy metal transport/detoxification protein [Kosmotoga pacifica]
MKLFIKGMTCNHCKMRVEKALSEVEGVESVEVNLNEGFAVIETSKDIPEELLKEVIEDTGYELVKVER